MIGVAVQQRPNNPVLIMPCAQKLLSIPCPESTADQLHFWSTERDVTHPLCLNTASPQPADNVTFGLDIIET